MPLDPARWDEAYQWVERLGALDDAARDAALATLSEEQPDLHPHVVAMLSDQRDLRARHFLGATALGDRVLHSGVADLEADRVLGAYRLIRALGAGGMGEVWLARRNDGLFEAPVALKLLHAHLGAPAVRSRFLREGRILGQLSHPNVARLVDAGAFEDGRLYLALEYVEGERLDRWCDRQHLDLRERVKLIVGVCEAVAHAHARLVVHRDLKPSNILVTADGAIKLLDFGIAKLIEREEGTSDATELTHVGGRVLTPEYAAPEQILGGPITVATDVYALGVLLYVVLSGRRPYGREGDNVSQLEREAVEREPSAPSDLAARELRTGLRGDLDTIVLRALKKAPAERYASVNDLADDLRRYLAYQPVLAQGDSLAYRMRKFVRRNRVAVTAGAGIALALAAGVAGVLVQSNQVKVEARKAEAVKDFLVDIFNRNSLKNPEGNAAREATAQQLLEFGADSIGTQLTEEPAVRAELLGTMALLFQNLSLEERAEQLADEQIRILRSLGGRDAGQPLVAALVQLAGIHANAGDYEKATADCEEALRVLDGLGKRRSASGSSALTLLGLVAYRTLPATDPTARARYTEALSIARDLERSGVQQLEAQLGLAWIAEQVDDYATAEANYRAILALADARPAEIEPIHKAGTLQGFGNMLVKLRRFEEAQPLLEQAVRLFEDIAGENNPLTADARRELARLLESRGERARAIEEVRGALAVSERVRGADDPNLTAGLRLELAGLLWRHGQIEEATQQIDECIDVLNGRQPDGFNLAAALGRRVPMFIAQGRMDDARTTLIDAKTRIGKLRGEKSANYALLEVWEAEWRLARHEVADAQSILQRVVSAYPTDGARLSAVAIAGTWAMASTEIAAGQASAAVTRLEALWSRLGADDRSIDLEEEARTRELLGAALMSAGKAEGALPHLRRTVELRTRMEDPGSPWLARARDALARAQRRQ